MQKEIPTQKTSGLFGDITDAQQSRQNKRGMRDSVLSVKTHIDQTKQFLGKRFSACSGMDSTKALNNMSKLANYDTVNQESKMAQPNNHLKKKFEEEKENP